MNHSLCRARWCFDWTIWTPTFEDLLVALASVQQQEKARILKYVYFKDAVGTLSGNMLMRKFISAATGLGWNQFDISRSVQGKPYFAEDATIQFNVSHQGKYIVLAGETGGARVGVDVMEMCYSGGKPLHEFFRIMHRQLTDHEWNAVMESSMEKIQQRTFYRIWCLKESYVKAIGSGLSIPLQTLEFKLNSKLMNVGVYVEDTHVFLNGQQQHGWRFQEVLLDEDYCACVALYSPSYPLDLYQPLAFIRQSFRDIVQSSVPITPIDEIGCEELFKKYTQERRGRPSQ